LSSDQKGHVMKLQLGLDGLREFCLRQAHEIPGELSAQWADPELREHVRWQASKYAPSVAACDRRWWGSWQLPRWLGVSKRQFLAMAKTTGFYRRDRPSNNPTEVV
jgi:hypothetical protein